MSEVLEQRVTAGSRKALSEILDLAPEEADVGGKMVLVEDLPVGAVVTVRAGDKIPVDGVVVTGTSSVDEAALTGESRPVQKVPGSKVSAGTINGPGYMQIESSARAADSTVARLVKLVSEAQLKRSGTEQYVENFAKVYTPVVVISALIT